MSYIKGNFIVVSRTVEATTQGVAPAEPKGLDKGAHWVGWVTIVRPDDAGGDHFAVWQDYRKRGFFIWKDAWEGQEPVAVHIGHNFDVLLERLEVWFDS